ncbi:SapC family protein [Thalassotalea litorea]|uniref:SapC family protein n=1 Tax=Thalassotalea litorea TaxID=2020715 RepID=UPI0037359A26
MSQQNVQPLNKNVHGNTKIKAQKNFKQVESQHLVPLVVHEFSRASAEFPVVFVKNSENGTFQPVALFGLKPGENLYTASESWGGTYVPACITHFPMALVPESKDSDNYMVIIATDNDVVNEEEGQSLFEENGDETEYLAKRKEAMASYLEHAHITRMFTKELADKDLLVQQNLEIDLNGEKIAINGLYLVNEKKLNELSDEEYLELRKRGFMSPIFAHLNSMHQVHRLVQKKAQQAA